MKIIKLFSIVMLINLASCDNNSSEPLNTSNTNGVNSPDIIATYNDGVISKSELNDHLLGLPPELRWQNQNTNEWITKIIKDLANEKQLIKQAKDLNVEDRILYQYEKHSLVRYLFTQQYISKFGDFFSIKEEDLLEYYNENIEDYTIHEERLVYHIFKSNLENPEKALKDINSLRQRIINGENFKLLAEKHSDSESRHLQGLIGKIKKGVMTADFDKVVFSLENNTPSDVIDSSDGYHIFYIANILKGKVFEFAEVKNIIQQNLLRKTKIDYLNRKAKELDDLNKYSIPNSEEELLEQINNDNSQSIVLEINDYKLSVSQVKFSLNELKKSVPSTKVKEIAYTWVLENAYREIIYQYMINNDIEFDQPKLLNAQVSKLIVKEFSKTKVFEYVNNHPELVNDYYQKNSKRFLTPIKFSFEKLSIPKLDNNIMNNLEQSIPRLNDGEIDLASLAKEYNGTISEMKSINYKQLTESEPQISSFASQLELNQHSFPYTTRSHYHIVKLTQRVDPKLQPLSLIRDKVLKKYVEINETEIFSKVLSELAQSVKIDQQNLDIFLNDYKKNI